MYELEQIGENSYYIESPVKTGLYKISETDVVLIDSGNDKDAAKKITKIIRNQCWNLKWIINTHSHADHIGGNAYLLEQFKCKAFSVGIELAFIKYPLLEPSFLYGGYPMKTLRNKFLMANPSDVLPIEEFETVTELSGFEFIRLDGHTFNMIGIKTPDDVWFLGDALNSETIIEKYHVSFLYNVRAYLESIERLRMLKGRCYVLAHADICKDMQELIDINQNKVLEIINLIESLCESKVSFEKLLKKIFDHYNLTMNANQYVLVGSTIKSYLSYLSDENRILYHFDENEMLWERICNNGINM